MKTDVSKYEDKKVKNIYNIKTNDKHKKVEYGIDKEGIQIHLWAYKLKFKHPVKDEIMEFKYYPNFK